MSELTAQRLRELLSYDPETGLLLRNTNRGSRPAGSVAGNTCADGRVQVYIDNVNYKAHRLIWLLVTGAWPTYDVDHIDGNPSNNRWSNLRDVPHAINLENRRGPTRHNPHKLLGVTKNRDGFGAQIKVDGKRLWLGTYATPQEAHSVYLETKRRLHAGCTI
jgi:HNH endonuclease